MKKRLVTLANMALNALYGRNITIVTSEGRYFLKTTTGHPLKRYLRRFDRYDRFLPYLSKVLPGKSLIDIGANVGDTLVLVKSVSTAEVVCVEPDQQFISYLKQNIERNHLAPVKLYPYPISSTKRLVSVEKNVLKCTSNMNEARQNDLGQGIQMKTFGELLNDLSIDINSIGIIKSDTDGFDWDCLNSIADYFDSAIDIHYPEFIFYEHQNYLNKLGRNDPDVIERERRYRDSLKRLWHHDYTQFYIFNNFGHLVRQTSDLNELFAITGSLTSNEPKKKLLNYFVDVLIARPSNEAVVEKALRLQGQKEMHIN